MQENETDKDCLSSFPSLIASSVWGLFYSKAEILADRSIIFQLCIVPFTLLPDIYIDYQVHSPVSISLRG
jgi:hypothetical protein